jgi:hypothetical protein
MSKEELDKIVALLQNTKERNNFYIEVFLNNRKLK